MPCLELMDVCSQILEKSQPPSPACLEHPELIVAKTVLDLWVTATQVLQVKSVKYILVLFCYQNQLYVSFLFFLIITEPFLNSASSNIQHCIVE